MLNFLLLLLWSGITHAYFADWSLLTRDRQPSCVSIPSNLTLCHNIGYNRMRLPNLLEHDTMQEVSQQAVSWIPLLNINCHPDTQLFLCSLFAPVCLERPIYPCRSLCFKVKVGCEGTMKTYGFPWPSMLDCDKFPLDNDMCIVSKTADESRNDLTKGKTTDGDQSCSARSCNQPASYENILTNFCRADFVVKTKFKRIRGRYLTSRKVKTVFKTWRGTPEELRKLRKPKLQLQNSDECCVKRIKKNRRKQIYLLMGKKDGEDLVPTLILPWTKDKELKRARRMFKQIDCSNLRKAFVTQ